MAIVATPIGNLGDMTSRAVEILRSVDLIACEDTRVTAKLLAAFGLRTPMTAYHDHNAARQRPAILQRLAGGGTVALVSDAGTPLVSDPGYKLVQAAIASGHPVTTAPGASALLAALTLSGLPSDRFLFAGFLPPRSAARRTELKSLSTIPATLIFYEASSRIAASLDDMATALGPRPAAVARELTKRFEEVRRDRLDLLAAAYRDGAEIRGEFVVIVGPPASPTHAALDEASIDSALAQALKKHSLREAAALVAAELGVPRKLAYARALTLKR